MTEFGYTEVPAVIRVSDGTKLSTSHQTPGAVKALLRDVQTNNLKTHADIFLVDKSKSAFTNLTPKDWAILGLGALVVVGATVATVKGVDHIKQQRALRATTGEDTAPSDIEIHQSSDEIALIIPSKVDFTGEQLVVTMGAAEWQELLRKVMMLNSLEERIWMILSSVRIEGGDENLLEWQQRMKKLSPQEFSNEIRQTINAHPELRDNEKLAEFIRLFINSEGDDGHETKRLDAE